MDNPSESDKTLEISLAGSDPGAGAKWTESGLW